jgi:DNA-binding NtrC family response regulator
VIELRLPSLSERPGDILPLAEYFLAGEKRLGEAARVALKRHYWPGNVRELKNIIQRALLLAANDTITPADLGFAAAPASSIHHRRWRSPNPIAKRLNRRWRVLAARSRRQAAELGLSRQALYRRMDRLGISRPAG